MPPVRNYGRKSINIESILNTPNPTDLVQLIRKNRGNPIVFNDSDCENQRNSFPLKFLEVPAAVQNTKKSLERNDSISNIANQPEKSSVETNKVTELFPTRRCGPHVKVKRLRESVARRSLLRDMERTRISSIFHPDATSTSMKQFGIPDAFSTPIQGSGSPNVLSSGSGEVDDNANKNTRPNTLINGTVGGKNTIRQSVSISLDATKHHTEKSIEPKSTGNAANSGTKYCHESIEISNEVERTIVNEVQEENGAHFAQVSHQNPASHVGVNKTHNSILESVQPNSTRTLVRSQTSQRSQIERTSVPEVPLATPQKVVQNPDSSVIISTLIKNIRRSEENTKKTISASKIPRRIIVNKVKPNRPASELFGSERSSIIVIPIYPPICHSNKKDEQSVEQQQQSVANATRKSLTEKVADQSLTPSNQHAAACSLATSLPLPGFQITSDEDSSNTNQEIPSDQCSSLRQAAHSNGVENSNRSTHNLREKSHFDVVVVETSNQHQAESHHMGHSSSQPMDLRLSGRRSSKLPTVHVESTHHMQPIPSTGDESSSDSNDSQSSCENIAKINELMNELNNDSDPLQRHNSSEICGEQQQLPELPEKLSNRENTVTPSDEFNESVFEGVTGRGGLPNDIVFDLSPQRGKKWMDMVLRKETTGASRSLFNRKRGKRVVSEIVPKQSHTLFEDIKSSLRKSNRRNSNRNSKRKLYSHIGADIEIDIENHSESHSENQSRVGDQRHTNSSICKLFGFFQPVVLDAAHKKPKIRNLKHAKTIRIETIQKLLDSWRPESEKRQNDQQPKESLGNEEEAPIFKMPEPPKRRKPIRKELPAKNASESSSLTSGTVAQTSASKSSRSTDRSNKTFESEANQQRNDRFNNFRNDDDSLTAETPIQNGCRKYSRSADRTITNTKSESKSLQRQRSKSATRVANVNDGDQIDSVLTLPTPTRKDSPKTNGLRRSARKHHAPRPYWTSKRDCYPIVEVNYKEPVIKENRKRKTARQPNRTKKNKLEMIHETVALAGTTDLSGSKKIADDLFDALKELSQTNDPSINTIRNESVAAASVSREDLPKSTKSKRPRKYTKKKTAAVAKSTTVADSGIQSSDQEGANPQRNTTAANNCLLSWLQNLVGAQTISSHPDLHRVFQLAGVTIVPSQHLTFNSVDGVDYAYYDDSFPDSEQHYGYMRFNPSSTKPIARAKKFELRFLSIVGELNLTIGEKSVQLKDGVFITIPKGVKYSLANRSEETALLFFIKT